MGRTYVFCWIRLLTLVCDQHLPPVDRRLQGVEIIEIAVVRILVAQVVNVRDDLKEVGWLGDCSERNVAFRLASSIHGERPFSVHVVDDLVAGKQRPQKEGTCGANKERRHGACGRVGGRRRYPRMTPPCREPVNFLCPAPYIIHAGRALLKRAYPCGSTLVGFREARFLFLLTRSLLPSTDSSSTSATSSSEADADAPAAACSGASGAAARAAAAFSAACSTAGEYCARISSAIAVVSTRRAETADVMA